MLKRLWSPTGLIDPINFHVGLNLIIGRYSRLRPQRNPEEPEQRGINGIGKSSVVRLLDFALLSDSVEKRFADAKYSFLSEEDHQLALLVDVRGQEVEIRRSFGDMSNVVISVGRGGEVRYKKDEAATILNGLFFPESEHRHLPGGRYRSLMQFFIKDDLASQARKDPIGFVSHGGANKQELMTLNLFLMGLPNGALIGFGQKKEAFSELKKQKSDLVSRTEKSTGKRLVELKTEVSAKERQVQALGASLQSFDLSEDFARVVEDVGGIEERISHLRQQVDRADRQLAKLRKFTSVSYEVDPLEVAEQYKLVSEALGGLIRRQLEEVLAFRKSLAESRLRFYGGNIREMESQRNEAFAELSGLEQRRSQLLRAVNLSLGPTSSMMEAFERFATLKVECERIAGMVSEVSALDTKINAARFSADEARRDALQALDEAEVTIREIRDLFVEIVDQAIGFSSQADGEGAYLDVVSRASGGMSQSPVDIIVEVPKSDALGLARLRLAAYDLTIFFHAVGSDLPLPRFLVHDGVFHAVARRTVVRALNYIHERRSAGTVFQYIVTFNEDELSATPEEEARDGRFAFDLEAVTILTLADSEDRMLFRRQFD